MLNRGGSVADDQNQERPNVRRKGSGLALGQASRRRTPVPGNPLSRETLAGLGKDFLLLETGRRTLITWGAVDLNRHIAIV
jgi:hypothetical protein